jgi:hypothetical protein
MLTEAQEEYYRTYEELFEMPGWAILLREFIQPELDDLPARAFGNAKNFPELVEARGKHKAYLEIAAIPASIETSKQSTIEQNEFIADEEKFNRSSVESFDV